MDALAAHRDYTVRVIHLMIWYVWTLSRRPDSVSILTALDQHVDLMRKTTLYDGRHPAEGLTPPVPEWDELKTELASRIAPHDDPDTSTLEADCWSVLEPFVTPNLQSAPTSKPSHGCWSYAFRDEKPLAIDIHFGNGYRPDSPFRDRRQDLIANLLKLIADAVEERPTVTTIQCDSWLNQFEPFAALFPQAWNDSLHLHGGHLATYGWWGQYMDERGAFNKTRAAKFRATGAHPYSAGEAECEVEPVVEHLKRLLRAR